MEGYVRTKVYNAKWLMPLGFAVSLLLFALSVLWCILRGFGGMETTWVFNIGTDIVSIAICAVIYCGCMMDSNGVSENSALFTTLVLVNAFALFFDVTSWVLQGVAALAFWGRVANALLYANGTVVIYLFWCYVTSTLEMESRRMKVVKTSMNILLLPDVLIKLANIFWPIYFIVDEAGVYRRSDYFIFSYLYLGIVMYTCVVELIGSKVPLRQKTVAVSFIAIPVLDQLLISRHFGMSTQYSSTLLSIVLIYGVLFADRGKSLAATENELKTAAGIQTNMLPVVFPDRSDFELFACMDPAREVGGDFYDYYQIDDDHLCLMIADVSGKGVPAALFMMSSMIILQNYALQGLSPSEILETANERICANNKEEMFVTVWLGILDLRTGKLTAANAGHEYPVIRRKGAPSELMKDRHGFVLGGMAGMKYREYEILLGSGDEIFLYTDGVPEATNKKNELYGTDRLLKALDRAKGASPRELLDTVREDVDRFVGEAEQFDDLTMMALRYIG